MANVLACPGPEQLKAIALGQMPEAGAAALIEHLEQCSSCATRLSAIVAEDTLVEAVRANDTARDSKEQQAVSALVAKVRALVSAAPSTGIQTLESRMATPIAGGVTPASAGEDRTAPPDQEDDGLAPPQGADEIGRLGPYRVLKVLGAGGMGKVFLAQDPQLQRSVALKVMKASLAKNSNARQRFLREARLAAAIEHDNIVHIYQVGEDRGVPFLAMQLLKGSNLDDFLRRSGTLPIQQVLRIGTQIADGLAAAHGRGMIHRDIKPGNIWLEAPSTPAWEGGDPGAVGRVKILDFGLARTSVPSSSAEEADGIDITQSGTVLGTPAYMSPEQARGEKVDQRCDLYSLGCVLYRMATGELPLKGPHTMAMLSALANVEPTAPHRLNPEIPQALSDLIMKLLAKDPAQRVGSAGEVVLALKRIERGDSLPPQGGDAVLATFSLDPSLERTATPSTAKSAPASFTPPTKGGEKSVPAPALRSRPSALRRLGTVLAAVALLALIGVGLLYGGRIIRFVTDQGELVIEVDDETVEIKILKDGVVVEDRTSKREFTLTAGKGVIEVLEKDGVKLATKQFELTRGGKTTVKVTFKELADARKPKDPGPAVKKDPPAIPAATDPDRRAAEWVLSIGGTIRIKENGKERAIKAVGDLPRGTFELSVVGLPQNPKVSDAGLAHFKDCKNLTSLDLTLTPVSDAGLAYLKDCKNLALLYLGNTKVSDAGLAHFKDCKNLTELGLSSTLVSGAGLVYFKDCKRLTSLDLRNTPVSDLGLAHFKDCKNLQDLRFGQTKLSDAGLAHFKDCKNLTLLDLGSTKVGDAGLAHFKDCKNLTSLNLPNTKLSDAGLAHFKDCQNLTFLDLANTQVSDAGLAHFKDCKNLTNLNLSGTKVSDAGLAHFKECKNFTHLYLSDTQVTDAGLGHFKDCKNVALLYLGNTKVSDAGLAHFKDCQNLTVLRLHVTRVSDAGLLDLAGLPSLTDLHLGGTRISLRGHEQLKTALPKCQITWSEPNRSVAESVLALGGSVAIGTPGQLESRPVKAAADLPGDYFQVRRVSLAGVAKPLDNLPEQLSYLRFPEFDRLESIDLSGITGLSYDFLAPIHGLQELSLAKAGLNESLATLPKLPALKRLVLDDNGIGGPGLASLEKQTALTELSLANAGLNDQSLAQLPKLPALKRLVLDGNDIRGPGLAHLRGRPELIDLSLGCPTLGDLLAKNLAELKQVKRLSLTGSGLTDAGIKHLAGLTNLEWLDLRRTKVSAGGIVELQKALPKCQIDWDGKKDK